MGDIKSYGLFESELLRRGKGASAGAVARWFRAGGVSELNLTIQRADLVPLGGPSHLLSSTSTIPHSASEYS